MCRRLFLIFFCCWVALFFAALPISAQEQTPIYAAKKKQPQGPRAIAVLEWGHKGPRLVPITIRIDQKFYDAELYLAQPIPMALDNGVIYEIQREGEALGDFTVQLAQQTPGGSWVGIGQYESKADQARRQEEAAKAAAEAASPKKNDEEDNSGPPVLKRPKAAKAGSDTKPEPESSTSKPEQKPPAPEAKPSPTPELHETSSDPNRPVLKRGKPKEEQAQSINNEAVPKKLTPPPPGLSTMQVAISDAAPSEAHPYVWSWANPEEQQKIRSQAEKMATAALTDYAAKTGGPKPGKLLDVDFHALDLSYSNSPDVILSARALPEAKPIATKRGAKAPEPPANPGLEYYVTIVGRQDIYATLQKSFAVATDNKHLDAFPRMQLVDAVDADGSGTGELLFRSTSDRSNSFVIYRELGYKLDELIRVPEPKD
jgi:hypothetical protein